MSLSENHAEQENQPPVSVKPSSDSPQKPSLAGKRHGFVAGCRFGPFQILIQDGELQIFEPGGTGHGEMLDDAWGFVDWLWQTTQLAQEA